MTETTQALAYIVLKAGRDVPLTLLRATTLLYLADWKSALNFKRQITSIGWMQPFVAKLPEIGLLLAESGISVVDQLVTGSPDPAIADALSREAQTCINFVLKVEEQKGWTETFRLAYSTYPMFSQPAHSPLNLVDLAQRYEQRQDIQAQVS